MTLNALISSRLFGTLPMVADDTHHETRSVSERARENNSGLNPQKNISLKNEKQLI